MAINTVAMNAAVKKFSATAGLKTRAAAQAIQQWLQPPEPGEPIGVYLTSQAAYLVRRLHSAHWEPLPAVLSETDAAAAASPASLPERLARTVRLAAPDSPVYIALDSRYYTQYQLTSEFEDARQIESTLKFDLEEPAATDATTLTASYWIHRQTAGTTILTAFAADRQTLTDLVLDFQQARLDPAAIEPDGVCLARLLDKLVGLDKHTDCLYLLANGATGYWVIPPLQAGLAPYVRTVLLPTDGDATALLVRQALQELAAWEHPTPLRRLIVLHPPANADLNTLSTKTGLSIERMPLSDRLHFAGNSPTDQQAVAPLWIAAGAALAADQKVLTTDWRRDFMPYKGKRRHIEASLRLASVGLTVLLLAIGLFFQLRAWRIHSYSQQLKAKLAEEYRAAMYGANPPAAESVVTRLRRTVANAKRAQEGLGLGDEKSVPARLTFLLEALNAVPAYADIAIQQIAITERTMRVKGDTNSRQSTLDLFEAIKKHPKLKIASERMGMVGNRDAFEFTLEPEK